MAEEMICEHAGDHRLADRHGADADARIVPALGHDLGVRATASTPANTNMAEQKKKLMWTLEQGLKDAWTPAVKDAWVAAYTLVTGVMKDAAKAEMKASA
jgi:hypothetical protein